MTVSDSDPEKILHRFRGRYLAILDHKGRFNLPAKIRKALVRNYGEEVEVTVSVQENYILMYPIAVSSQIAKEYDSYDGKIPEKRESQRRVFLDEEDCEMKSGKILCPARFRKKVGFKNGDEVVVVGTNRSFEVWPKDQFEETYGAIEL